MAILSVVFGSLFIAAANLCMRRSMDAGGKTINYLVILMGFACLSACLFGPIKTGSYAINGPIVILGLISGVILALMFCFLGKSLGFGPPGLTFAILSSATIVPAITMAIVFGASLGFIYTGWHGIGSFLVLIGLFWAGKGLEGMRNKRIWIFFAIAMFSMHALLLIIYQWRTLLLETVNISEVTQLFTLEQIQSQWFLPVMYAGALLILLGIFLRAGERRPTTMEWLYGCGGGFCSYACTLFLLRATELASDLERAMIFPLSSIGTIVFSNLWGQRLYREKVNWRACWLCALGIVMGTIDWNIIRGAAKGAIAGLWAYILK